LAAEEAEAKSLAAEAAAAASEACELTNQLACVEAAEAAELTAEHAAEVAENAARARSLRPGGYHSDLHSTDEARAILNAQLAGLSKGVSKKEPHYYPRRRIARLSQSAADELALELASVEEEDSPLDQGDCPSDGCPMESALPVGLDAEAAAAAAAAHKALQDVELVCDWTDKFSCEDEIRIAEEAAAVAAAAAARAIKARKMRGYLTGRQKTEEARTRLESQLQGLNKFAPSRSQQV